MHFANAHRLSVLIAAVLLCLHTSAAADEAGRWQALFTAVPALPATPLEAAQKISARSALTDGLGYNQLRIEIADTRLRALQRQVDQMYEPIVKAGAAQLQRVMEATNKDPVLTELSRKIDKTWQPNLANPGKLPSPGEVRQLDREVERVLGPMPAPGAAPPAARTEIGAYRRELQSATPRTGQFMQRLNDQQRHHAQQHALADREAIAQLPGADAAAVARAVVARHQALAQRQLAEASALLQEAREALAPRVQRLTELARAAEQRNAPAAERDEAYVLIKAYVEALLTMHRETVQDVGFWGGVRAASALPTAAQASTRSLYELALAPGFELRANGEQAYGLPYYPGGRTIIVGLPLGIR